MKRLIYTVLILGFIASGFVMLSGFIAPQAARHEWSVMSSSVKFKIKNAGFTVDGSFKELNARIIFDADNLSGSSIDATVNARTINTGNGTRDGHLRGEKYFDVEKFQVISLKSSSFSKQLDGRYTGDFKLTIKGVSKNVVIPFTYTEKDKTAVFSGNFTINRLDYGVGSSSIVLSDNVTILLEVSSTKR